jgi:hypothetical protein
MFRSFAEQEIRPDALRQQLVALGIEVQLVVDEQLVTRARSRRVSTPKRQSKPQHLVARQQKVMSQVVDHATRGISMPRSAASYR